MNRQQQQEMNNKWLVIDEVQNEVNMVQKLQGNPNLNIDQLTTIQEKLNKLKNLKSKVEKEDKELKLEYLILMRERNVYFEKLKMIQTIGDNNNWSDESGLLQAIKNLLANLGDNKDNEEEVQ